jgi:hypothetical protein
MTREERLIEEKRKREERLRDHRRRLSDTNRELRDLAAQDRARRRKKVGLLADEAGLFVWDDTTLAQLFGQLARLAETPNPVAMLDSLLSDTAVSSSVAVPTRIAEVLE